MPPIDWTIFEALPGSRDQNFENLCRGLMRLHFDRFGLFKALANQPGVEFHIKLSESCQLGDPPRWFGWQCKYHRRTRSGDLASASRKDIESSIRTTEKVLPEITDWILWTPYTLSKKDQEWFYSLTTDMRLQLWGEEDIDTYLNGYGLLLRNAYFGELVITPHNLEEQHLVAIQPIRERWMEPVHQTVDAERTIRRMLGEPGSWDQLIAVGKCLRKAADVISNGIDASAPESEKTITLFVAACSAFADTLLRLHEILAQGDLDIIQQKLRERKTLISDEVRSTPRRLRNSNLPIALDATNALDDMRVAQGLLDEVEELLGVGLVALLADAGGGKTQIAAHLSMPQEGRPAGIFLHGRDLHRGQTLDGLAHHFSINGIPLTSMERLLAALDAAGKRAKCRLPVLIDGLNEAENPKDWKPVLAILSETIKGYPNVLVVCTLRTGERQRVEHRRGRRQQANDRESFAVMSLPDGIRRIESEGFGGDVHDAIKKYFNHFKINPGDAEIPVEFLQHPLTLRIFCEVTNPKRKSEVTVDYFPASLSPLFEKYVANACNRIALMPNLSYSYTIADLELAVYQLGLELWKAKKREVKEADYKIALSSTALQWDKWDSNIVNLFAQEGIVFRNPGTEPGQYTITSVYDALGGYIVANYLITKHANDITFEWFKEPDVIELFTGENSHELAFDIFNSLVALAPRRMYGQQIWKEAPDPFRNAALRFTTGLEAKYLDKDTVVALLELLSNNPNERKRLFSRLRGTRGAANHPLNAVFLDTALRAMTVSERDLSWTEWVRATRTERFNELLSMERKWKEDLSTRTSSDRLRAKWVMWLLTSTDRELRDIATRALYWFGRGDPAGLFDESLKSLGINDPYIPERMLAASYGVAMARHVDLSEQTFINTTLTEYARKLYDEMFAEGAPYSTTHSLMREYGYRVFEIVSLYNSNLFSSREIKRSKSPFSEGGLRGWGESETPREEMHGQDSPFRMDFENYTIGSLVPDRGNYNYKHKGYRKVRAQILWRVEQLGWTSDLFKSVDSSIANERHSPRVSSDPKKIDRYGKKYSWIAFFEMSGLLHDQGKLEYWRERTAYVDIDPSFPERVRNNYIITADFLGDAEMEMKEWIARGQDPDVNPYLRLAEVNEEKGTWVALDGFITQEDETRGRRIFCFIRSFIIAEQDAVSFINYLSHQDLGGRWLPEKPSVIYTFAGEIPWCSTFPHNGLSKFSFITKEEIIKVQKTESELYLDGIKLRWSQIDLIRRRLGLEFGETEKQPQISDEDLERIESRDVPIEVEEVNREFAEFNALIPVCDFGWESYHTTASDAGHATTLAKEITSDLELVGQPQTFDLFTKYGVKATCGFSDHSDDYGNHQTMLFIRESLLKDYLKRNALTLVWAIWGEREYSTDQFNKLFHGPNHPEQAYAVYSTVKLYNC
ncbi:hypothetical protein C4544_01860 [candidate division WS5 bacterium]|uniref:Uncharacterized protein n=1 Tax=candidate division WS5 bacterium TaxID=2093353 RepID=A0A419DF65_9BACT|nr:MAG: hypothetical protein C4544_01860 [candidate division WS5 bacterium]